MKILFDYELLNGEEKETGLLQVDLVIKAGGQKMQQLVDYTHLVKSGLYNMLRLDEVENCNTKGTKKDGSVFSMEMKFKGVEVKNEH